MSDDLSDAGWLDGLPEEARAFAAAKNWAGPAAVVESYCQLEKMLGADKAGRALVLPARDDDAEGWRAVHARLGCPDQPEGYDLDLPDGFDAAEDADEFRALAHEMGLSAGQARRLTGWWRGRLEAAMATQAAAGKRSARAAEAALRDTWGGDYDLRRSDAERAHRRFLRGRGGADGLAELEALSGKPAVMGMLADIGAAIGEDRHAGGGFDGGFALSPEEARRELEQIQRDKAFMAAFLDKDHPEHQRHVLRARRLNRLAAGLDPDG